MFSSTIFYSLKESEFIVEHLARIVELVSRQCWRVWASSFRFVFCHSCDMVYGLFACMHAYIYKSVCLCFMRTLNAQSLCSRFDSSGLLGRKWSDSCSPKKSNRCVDKILWHFSFGSSSVGFFIHLVALLFALFGIWCSSFVLWPFDFNMLLWL